MLHEVFIPNKDLFGGLWPEDRDQWPEDYTAEFDGVPRGFCADLEEGPDAFSWNGVPGTRYRVDAFLPSWAWYENASSLLAKWRLAVFAPREVDPRKPVVMMFGGIGMDYFDTSAWLPALVEKLGCICVAYDTHMTGVRNLEGPYSKFESNIGGFKPKYWNRSFGNDQFTTMTRELSFNARQVMEFVARKYKLPHRRFVTLGFSLGGYYASQIALSQPTCAGCSAGGAMAVISDYWTFVPRVDLPDLPWPFTLVVPDVLKYGAAVAAVRYCAYDLEKAREGQSYYFSYGTEDGMATWCREKEDAYRARIVQNGARFIPTCCPGAPHDPFSCNGRRIDLSKLGDADCEACIGRDMLEGVRQLIRH